jgi:hypothetical protein
MARIELKHTIVRMKDGLSGSGAVNEPTTAPIATDAEFDIDTVVLNAGGLGTDVIPLGARFVVDGETDASQDHAVTARTPSDGLSATTNIEFSPALGAGTYADGGVLTFAPCQLDIKIGDGNITYTESNEYEYDLDRDMLDTVREGAQVPIDVSIDFVYEFITTGTSEEISVMDALKKKGGASEWRSSSADPCEPYSIDIEVIYTPLCTTSEIETTTFPEYRSESREVDFSEATVTTSGRCNVTEPIITRTAQ